MKLGSLRRSAQGTKTRIVSVANKSGNCESRAKRKHARERTEKARAEILELPAYGDRRDEPALPFSQSLIQQHSRARTIARFDEFVPGPNRNPAVETPMQHGESATSALQQLVLRPQPSTAVRLSFSTGREHSFRKANYTIG